MNTLREAAQQALEALEADNSKLWPSDRRTAAYFNLRAALAEPVQEPVAWMVYTEGGTSAYVTDNPNDLVGAYRALPLYTAPLNLNAPAVQKRLAAQWGYVKGELMQEQEDWCACKPTRCEGVGKCRWHAMSYSPLDTTSPQRKPLPASEIVTMYDESPRGDSDMIAFARAIERAHGIGGNDE